MTFVAVLDSWASHRSRGFHGEQLHTFLASTQLDGRRVGLTTIKYEFEFEQLHIEKICNDVFMRESHANVLDFQNVASE